MFWMSYWIKRVKIFVEAPTLIFPKILSKVSRFILSLVKADIRFLYTFYKVRPTKANNEKYCAGDHKNYALCIQGPCANPKFVSQAIDFYLRAFPGISIYYATNADFQHNGINVKIVPKPSHTGYGNFNNQRQCTISCLEAASLGGNKFTLKIRDDLLIRNRNVFYYLMMLSKTQTSSDNARVLFSSLHTRIHFPFHLCDFMQFGKTTDLLAIWRGTRYAPYDLDKKTYVLDHVRNTKIYDPRSKCVVPHVDLGFSTLSHCTSKSPSDNYEKAWQDWMNLFEDHIGVFNLEDIGVMFDKYDTTLKCHRDLENTLYHSVTTDVWMGLVYSRMQTGRCYPYTYKADDLY